MTYLDYLNQFNLWLESNALPASSQLMYFKLLNVFNRAGWPETVQVDNRRMMLMIDVQAESTVIRARDKLVESGFICYEKGKKGAPNRYSLPIIYFDCESISDSISASISASKTASISASHIKTKNKTKTKKDPPTPPQGAPASSSGRFPYEQYRQAFVEACPSLPAPHDASRWTDTRKRALRRMGMSVEQFRELCKRVEKSDFLTGRDGKWAGCSLDWLLKPSNWGKVLEGNYDNRREQQRNSSYDIDEMERMSSLLIPEDL